MSRAGSLPSFSSFRPMPRPLDGIQAMSMGAMGPRGPPHHPHLPPSTTAGSGGAGAEGALRVSPHHLHHTPSSHLSPVGSEGGSGVILSPHGQPHLNHHHHPHHHDQQHHPDPRLAQEMINFHHHHHQQHQQHHNNGNGSGSSNDLNCSVSTSSGSHISGEGIPNGPSVSVRQLSPSSRRSLSPGDTDRRRERKNGEIMEVDEDRRTEGAEDGDGRKSRERRQSMGSDYNRNGDVGAEDGELHPHHHRNGPRRSSSRDGYMGMRSPEHGTGSLERSLSDQLHHDEPQRQYHRSRSVSPDYRHHHHRHLDPRDHLVHPSRPLEEEHLRKMAGSSSYPCDSVMDLSMSKPPALTSASPPSRSSSTASSSHVVDKEVAGVTNNSSSSNNNNNISNSSASAAAMPPPKTPTSAALTPTALPNGGLGGILGLVGDGRRRTASSSEFGESESEPGKRDVTTTSATPTNSGADSSIHHCQHCNIFFNDYTMFHLHESLHMPYEDHPFRCPSCGTHCQDKIEFMFHTVWHVKYPHTIPNYTPFREGFLASSPP